MCQYSYFSGCVAWSHEGRDVFSQLSIVNLPTVLLFAGLSCFFALNILSGPAVLQILLSVLQNLCLAF